MAKKVGEDTQITLDLKTIGMAAAGIGTVVAMWFALQADIAEAKVRQTIMTTQEDVSEIKGDIKRIEEKIDQLK